MPTAAKKVRVFTMRRNARAAHKNRAAPEKQAQKSGNEI
jgi:hypothetical protein